MTVVAPKFEDMRGVYLDEWRKLTIPEDQRTKVEGVAKQIVSHKPLLKEIEQAANGVPWYFVGGIWYRESTFNETTWLGNGDPINKVSTHVPAGYGPFKSFKEGAVKALEIKGYVGATDWSFARQAYRLETYNGWGPRVKREKLSGYVYACSNLYTGGMYVADGPDGWRDDKFDQRPGVLTLYKQLLLMGAITLDLGTPEVRLEPDDELAHGTIWLQWALNRLGAKPTLDMDGDLGPATMKMVKQFQEENGLNPTGLPDEKTYNEVQLHLDRKDLVKTDVALPDHVPPELLEGWGQQAGTPSRPAAPDRPLSVLEQIAGTFSRLFGHG